MVIHDLDLGVYPYDLGNPHDIVMSYFPWYWFIYIYFPWWVILVIFPDETPNIHTYIWANYNDLTTASLEIMVYKGNHPQMALIQVSEIL